MDLRSLEGAEYSARKLLMAALHHYSHISLNIQEAVVVMAAAHRWKARVAADASLKPETTLDIITAEYSDAVDAVAVARRELNAERERLLDAQKARRASVEEEEYQRRKAAKEAAEEARLRRKR
jgi:hypothetical protein